MPKTSQTRKKHTRRTPEQQIADLEAQIEELRARSRLNDQFSPKAVLAERERLELSAADYGELVGVSPLTIYGWEKGRTKPRVAQLERWLEVKGIGKKEAWKKLGLERARLSTVDVGRERERLELSAADYGELVGVSAITIYNWEKGKTEPQQAQCEKLEAVKGIRKEEAWERLGIDGEFSPEAVASERERLELSAADYGELVGVSPLTIYNWEKGKSQPQAKQLEKWLAVKGIGKRAAWKQLGY